MFLHSSPGSDSIHPDEGWEITAGVESHPEVYCSWDLDESEDSGLTRETIAADSGNQALEGGGFYVSGGYGGGVTLTNAVIDHNNALVRGGGFRNSGVDTTVTIDGGVISNNVAQYEHGGGFYNNGQAILKAVDITGNSVLDLDLDDGIATARQEDAYGGGFYNAASAEGIYQAGVVDIAGGSITNNVAYGYGGGFWNRGGTVTITGTALDRVEIAGNQAGAAGDANAAGARSGGGFWNTDHGIVNLTHVSFNNAAGTNPNQVTVNSLGQVTGSGAGFFNSTQGVVNLNQVDISGHTASEGAAFYQDGVQSKVIGTDVTLTDNYARTRGGAFANRSTGAYVELTNSVISGNTVENEHGGGFYNNGTVTLVDTDVTHNTLLDLDNANRNGAVGGAFFNPGGTVYLKDTALSDNIVWGSGGGFYNDGGIVEGEDVVVDGNRLFYGGSTIPGGGGFLNTNQGKITLTNAVISNNSTGLDTGGNIQGVGGGFYNLSQGEVTLQGNSQIVGNRAADGAGFYNSSSGSMVTLTGAAGNLLEVQNNTARLRGGGFRSTGNTLVHLSYVSLEANIAQFERGGGFYADGAVVTGDHVLISNNQTTGNPPDASHATTNDEQGAGFWLSSHGKVTLADSEISGNTASADGGGFYVNTGVVTLTRTLVTDNRAENSGGGFLSESSSQVHLEDSSVSGNIARDHGGGFYARNDTEVTALRTHIDDNLAGYELDGVTRRTSAGIGLDLRGGGFSLGDGAGFLNLGWTETVAISGDSSITHNFSLNSHGGGFRNDGILHITGTSLNPIEISGNYSRPTITGNNDGVGGGFYNTSHGFATLTDVRIEDNVAYARGGGFYNAASGTVTIRSSDASVFQSTIVNNRTEEDLDSGAQRGHGGGFYNTNAFSMVSLTDVLLGNNIAADDGGGFYQESNFSQVSLTRVEILNNVADDEGGGFSNASNGSIVLMDTVRIEGNETTTGNAAGFRNAGVIQGTTVTVTNNKLVATGDQVGAGFYNTAGNITLVDLILENNLGGGRGGGFYNATGGIVDISSNLIRSRISGHSVVNGSLDGGGFYVADAGTTVRLTGVDVLNNSAGDDGGGFVTVSDKAFVFLTDVLFAGNIAGLTTAGSGGAFNNAAAFSQVRMDNVRIANNATLSENGGGFRNVGQIYGKNVVVSGNIAGKNDQIANNDSNRIGGGFFNTGSSALIDLSLVEITDNDAHGRGGGFYSDGASQVKLTDFIIARNTTDQGASETQGRGGGFWNSGGADVTLNRGEISENESFGHGGGFYQQDAGSSLTATNVTISGNYAGVDQNGSTVLDTVGGGFYALSAGAAVTLNHVTIANNRVNRNGADAGAGFRVDTAGNKVTLENSIVFGNFRNVDSGTPIVDDVDNRTTTSVDFVLAGNNIIGVSTGNAMGGNLDGRRSEDPQLGALLDHGGAVLPSGSAARTHLPGAPAVDQAAGSTLTEDQRGFARPLGAAADLGAVEVNAPAINDDTATVSEDGPPASINLTGNDAEGETGDLSVIAAGGSEGSVSINPDGDGVTYDPNGQFDHLAAGETAVDTFHAGLQDDQFGQTGAGTFIEHGGVVAGEATQYANYAAAPGADLWQPKNETTDNPNGFTGSRTGDFLQALPDGGGGPGLPPNGGPFVDYKVVIATAGEYTLFLRVAGFDGGSDSFFAGIVELQDGIGGANADWYAYQAPTNGQFGWRGTGDPEDASPTTLVPATFMLAAGTYTVRIMPREDGAALDAWALVNTSLAPAPTGTAAGPAQSTLIPGLLSQVQVTVTGVNDGPVLTGGASDLTVDEGATASLNLTGIVSFTDADLSDTHTISIDWGDGTVQAGLSATLDMAGLANLGDPSGPTPNQFSLDGAHAYADQGIYTVTVTIDDQQGVVTHTFEVTVNNVAPTAADDTASTPEDTAVIIPLADLLANDTSSEPNANDNVQISIVTAPANGTLTLVGAGLRYTPNHGFNGADTFTYTIDDGEGSLLTYTSNVNVFPGHNPPANLTAGQVESDSAATIAVERQQFRLGASLTVDAANPAGVTYDNGNNPADGVLAAGTLVNSHLVHFDQAQATGNGQIATTITFDSPILGLIWGDANLNATDSLLGNSSTIYPNGPAHRGILDEADGDSIAISADGRTLTITLNVTDGGIDQLRVLTAPLAQETATVAVTVNGTPDPTWGGFVSSTTEDTVLTVPVTNPTWIQQGLLNPDTNIFDQDQMGQQIDLDGDLAVIGGDQTGVLEDIYVYRRDSAGNWNLEQRLSNRTAMRRSMNTASTWRWTRRRGRSWWARGWTTGARRTAAASSFTPMTAPWADGSSPRRWATAYPAWTAGTALAFPSI